MSHPLRSAAPLRLGAPARPGLVSIIIVENDGTARLPATIDNALAQSYADLEVLVVRSDSSTDAYAAAAPFGPRVRQLLRQEPGLAAQRNQALREAAGEFVAFMDPGDEWRPWKIAAQVAALRCSPSAAFVWADMALVDDAGTITDEHHLRRMHASRATGPLDEVMPQVATLASLGADVPPELERVAVRRGDLFGEILLGNVLHSSTVLLRRGAIERSGGFDASFVAGRDDYEFYVRLCSTGLAVFLDAPCCAHRAGVAEQQEWSRMLRAIARANLRAIRKWAPPAGQALAVDRRLLRRRIAESYGWLAEAELDAGHQVVAGWAILASLARLPRVDRRSALLVRCALPAPITTWLRGRRANGATPTA